MSVAVDDFVDGAVHGATGGFENRVVLGSQRLPALQTALNTSGPSSDSACEIITVPELLHGKRPF
jgi:hypothetical protein